MSTSWWKSQAAIFHNATLIVTIIWKCTHRRDQDVEKYQQYFLAWYMARLCIGKLKSDSEIQPKPHFWYVKHLFHTSSHSEIYQHVSLIRDISTSRQVLSAINITVVTSCYNRFWDSDFDVRPDELQRVDTQWTLSVNDATAGTHQVSA